MSPASRSSWCSSRATGAMISTAPRSTATGATAMVAQTQPGFIELVMGTPLIWVLLVAMVVMSVALSGFATRMPAPVAFLVFFGYSVLMGVALTPIFWHYTGESIAATFF